MSLPATHSETSADSSARMVASIARRQATPVQTHVDRGFWKGACVAALIGLTSWLVIARVLS